MVTIYQDYGDEPEDSFLPLPEELASEFYALEMDGYTADIEYFAQQLPHGGSVLELGCGTGRVTARLTGTAGPDRLVIGIDISMPMLQRAIRRKQTSDQQLNYLCMDMVHLAFAKQFSTILIPYNTLNVLRTEEKILACLNGCRHALKTGGRLIVQLFTPSFKFIQQEKTFQFQLFDRPAGGRIIKEILKRYQPRTRTVHIEERFRVRPMQQGFDNEDYNTTYTIAGFSAEQWISLFGKAGFSVITICGDYAANPYNGSASSTLLATLTLS